MIHLGTTLNSLSTQKKNSLSTTNNNENLTGKYCVWFIIFFKLRICPCVWKDQRVVINKNIGWKDGRVTHWNGKYCSWLSNNLRLELAVWLPTPKAMCLADRTVLMRHHCKIPRYHTQFNTQELYDNMQVIKQNIWY